MNVCTDKRFCLSVLYISFRIIKKFKYILFLCNNDGSFDQSAILIWSSRYYKTSVMSISVRSILVELVYYRVSRRVWRSFFNHSFSIDKTTITVRNRDFPCRCRWESEERCRNLNWSTLIFSQMYIDSGFNRNSEYQSDLNCFQRCLITHQDRYNFTHNIRFCISSHPVMNDFRVSQLCVFSPMCAGIFIDPIEWYTYRPFLWIDWKHLPLVP